MKLTAALSLVLSLLTSSHATASTKVSVSPTTNSFIDTNGDTIIFHGINSVGKAAREAVSDDQMDVMVDLGFNVVRLGFSWDLYETAPDSWDETYLDYTMDIVQRLASRGIYSFIDMHQDVWSKQYCAGHGFPEWYSWPSNSTEFQRDGKWAFPIPLAKPTYGPDDAYSEGYGIISNCGDAEGTPLGWAGVYATQAISNAVQLYYNNADGRLDKFVDFWKRTAKAFKDEPYVLAYELVNEPWVGDTFADPTLIVPSVADKKNLAPFYDRLADGIRSVDPDTIIFYEPSTGGNIQDTFESGFDAGPGGTEFDDRNAMSYHVYCPMLQTDIGDASKSKLVEKVCEKASGWQIGVKGKDVSRLNTAGILSEFGAIDPNNPDALKYLSSVMSNVDEYLHSWTYWYMHIDVENGNPEYKTLARSYARRTSGVVKTMAFDIDSSEFKLEYTSAKVGGETEIFCSTKYYYESGMDVAVEGPATFSVEGDFVRVTTTEEGQPITVTVTKK
jgi:endoglycosylceramidase